MPPPAPTPHTVTVPLTFQPLLPHQNENSDHAVGSEWRSIALANDFGLPQHRTKTRKIQLRRLMYVLLSLQLFPHPAQVGFLIVRSNR
jgi:hypothetical protein